MIPTKRAFDRRFSCNERHPGLCWHADRLVYDDTLNFVRNLEKLLAAVSVDSGPLLLVSREGPPFSLAVHLAGRRARRHYAPQVLFFAALSEIRRDGCISTVAFREQLPLPHCLYTGYDFISAWSVGIV